MTPLRKGRRRWTRWLLLALIGGLLLAASLYPAAGDSAHPQTEAPQVTEAPETEPVHGDPFSTILLELAVIILAAAFGRWLAGRFEQPSVLGELLIGMIVGNAGYWLGVPFFILVMHMESANAIFAHIYETGASVAEAAQHVFSAAELQAGAIGDSMVQIMTGPQASDVVIMGFAVWLFSNLGVILLLFVVGLESSVEEMLGVGKVSLRVAVVGVVAPFLLGLGAGAWLLAGEPFSVHLFLAATLCATSVGITARVFKDLGKLHTRETRIILGAAVIDDVLGLIILAIVVGIVQTGALQVGEVLRITVLSAVFLGAILFFGDWFVRRAVRLFSQLEKHHAKVLFSLPFAFLLAWLAGQIGLAPIVGAFAAGLILSEEHFIRYSDHDLSTRDAIAPIEAIFAPIFFVLMGMQVNLATFAHVNTLWLALAFTVAAIIGKLVAGWPAGRGLDRLSVGIGMVPRGEVGLIFASIGKALGVVSDSIFSAVVMMVIVTTLITPLALKWSLFRQRPATPAQG